MDLFTGVILFTLTAGGHVHHIDFDTPAQCEAAKAVIVKNNVEANVCKTFGSGSLACIVQIDCIPLPFSGADADLTGGEPAKPQD